MDAETQRASKETGISRCTLRLRGCRGDEACGKRVGVTESGLD